MGTHNSLENLKIARRYAKSLFDLAENTHALDKVEAKLKQVQSFFAENNKLVDFVSSPLVAKERQQKFIDLVLKELSSEKDEPTTQLLHKFFAVLIGNGRLNIFKNIAEQFKILLLKARGQVNVSVTSAVALADAQQQSIIENLKSLIHKDILLETHIDKSIVGGFIINFGSYQIDNSILTKLNSLKFALKEVD